MEALPGIPLQDAGNLGHRREAGQSTSTPWASAGRLLRGPGHRSSWHTKHYALVGLFRFALQRGLLSTSPLPYFVPRRPEYARPYIYSTDELQRILDGSKILDARNRKSGQAASIPPLTFRTLSWSLTARLRLSSAGADRRDVDLSANRCRRLTKFFKTRMLDRT
jgi:hypothetical protein